MAVAGGAPAVPARAAGNYATINMLGFDNPQYNLGSPFLRFGDAFNPENPGLILIATDHTAWNGVATGMFSAGPSDFTGNYPGYIGTNIYLIDKHIQFLMHGMASQLYWRQFGLTSAELAQLFLVPTLDVYRNDVLAVWQGGELAEQRLVSTKASATFEALLGNAFGYITPSLNNGVNSISYFDRHTFIPIVGWASTYSPADALTPALMPTLFTDLIIDFFSRCMLEFAPPCTYENAPGTFGFELPEAYEVGGGIFLPLMSSECAVFTDKPWSRTIRDGRTFYNDKLRRWKSYAGALAGVLQGYTPVTQAVFAIPTVAYPYGAGFFDIILTGTFSAHAWSSPTGEYNFYYSTNIADNTLFRQHELKLVGAALPTWRVTGGPFPKEDYKYKSKPTVSGLIAPKTKTLKQQTSAEKDPLAQGGQPPQ